MKSVIVFFLLTAFVEAANWLMLQGTQKSPEHTPWGFFQVNFEENSASSVVANGINKTPFAYVAPELQKQSQLQLARFRLGIRGGIDDANNINYFFLTEFAPNGINNPLGDKQSLYITDASLTFKYLPVYTRVGIFKYPGSEEGLMTRFASPFVNFTTVTNQLMLERFVSSEVSAPLSGVGAFRDSGAQFFQSYEVAKESRLSLAYMLGNGSGLSRKNLNKNELTHYVYASYEKLLGKRGSYRQESLKLYGWMQQGKRYLESDDTSYARERSGVGVSYYDKGLRLEAEYMQGKGMIFNGASDINPDPNSETWNFQHSPTKNSKASGYYVASIYELGNSLELLARYDRYDRMLDNKKLYRVFETFTTGFSHKFKNYNRIDFNYAINSIRAPQNSAANELLKSSGNILSIQFTLLLK